MKESGQFSEDGWAQTTTLDRAESGWESITIRENALKPFFQVDITDTEFVLKVGLSFPHCTQMD